MKIVLDVDIENPNDVICKVGSRVYGKDMPSYKQNQVNDILRKFIINNTKLTDYEEDCMWMSYRYCIGRHTIASHMHANDIWENCKGRMSKERSIFTAYDINREIEQSLQFGCGPAFIFPITSLNRIYTSALDIFCQFVEDFDIQKKEDLLKYYEVRIKLADNERGYTFETITWEEHLRPQVHKIVSKYYGNDDMSIDFAWKYFETWESGEKMNQDEMIKQFEEITRNRPSSEHFYLTNIDDLMVWNHLVHMFDLEHHHKSILKNGKEVEWFWTYVHDTYQKEDEPEHYYQKEIGYKRIRMPISSPIGSVTEWIPDESIKEDIY